MKYIVILFFGFFSYASAATAQVDTKIEQSLGNITSSSVFVPQKDTYIGSPYFTGWHKGYLVLDNSKKTSAMLLRYNMANNSIQFIREETIYAIAGKKIKKYVIYTTDGNIIFKSGFRSKKYEINTERLLRVIYIGKAKLLARHTSQLLKNVPAYGVAGDVNEYTSDTEYYLVTADGTYHEVELEKDDILEALPGNNKKLKEFVNKTGLNYSDQMQLDNILSYYDMLLKAKSKR